MRLSHIFLIFGIVASLATSLIAESLHIAVAANVSYAIEPLIKAFEKTHKGIKIKPTIGSSGKLTAQILRDAPYDLFLSANTAYPQKLYEQKRTLTPVAIYAKGALSIISKRKINFDEKLRFLEDDTISRIAIANPKTAPYGIASFEALKNAAMLEKIKKKFVYGESIAQTLTYTLLAADLGFVAKSSLYSPKIAKIKKKLFIYDVPLSLYTPIAQGCVVLAQTKHKEDALAFYHFLQTQDAQKIFQDFGYTHP